MVFSIILEKNPKAKNDDSHTFDSLKGSHPWVQIPRLVNASRALMPHDPYVALHITKTQ